MTRKFMRNDARAVSSTVALMVALTAYPALAQTAEKPDSNQPSGVSDQQNEEILVTARKRSESAQNVPLTVTVVSGEQLAAAGVSSISSLPRVASGLSVSTNANNITSFRVRGLGSETSSESFEQSVPLFVNGIYQGRGQSYAQALFDIDHIEIVKGTQAALLGKNTSLGAVITSTRTPENEFSFNGLASYEFELRSHNFEAGMDIPLTDTLSLRLAGQLRRQGGWVTNPIFGSKYPRANSKAGRATLQWKPTSDFDATLVYQEYASNTLGQPEEYARDSIGRAAANAAAAGYTGFEATLNYSNAASDPLFGETTDSLRGRLATGTINYDVGGGYTVTSLSSYSKYHLVRIFDADLLPGRYSVNAPATNESRQITQELRIASPSEDPFNFVAGALYLNEKWALDRTAINFGALSGDNFEQTSIDTKSISAFGQANLEFTPSLTASLGARVTHDNRTADFSRVTTRPGLFTTFLFPDLAGTLRRKETNVDGSFGLQFKPDSSKMFYASFSRGTKGGGFLNLPTNLAAAEFPSERADTFELGAKLRFGPNIINLSAFRTKIKDFQTNLFNGLQFTAIPVPVRSYGIELDSSIKLLDTLRWNTQVTWANPKNLASGTVPQNAPKWSGNSRITYDAPIGGGFDLNAELGVQFKSFVIWNTVANTVGLSPTGLVFPSEAYGLINGRLGLAKSNDWEIALIGENLNDKKYVAYARVASFQTGATTAALGKPRTIMVQFTIKR